MRSQFDKLNQLLIDHEPLWKPPAFTERHDSRLDKFPELNAWLSRLSSEQIDHLQVSDSELLSTARDYFPVAQDLLELTSVPTADGIASLSLPKFWDTDIPGRKLAQIKAFTSALFPVRKPLTEWCCGKQHLGRLIAELSGESVLGLEIDNKLITQAESLSIKRRIEERVTAHHCDVLEDSIDQTHLHNRHQIALHACGGLHVSMLEKSVAEQVPRISLSPCCYHRFNSQEIYQALSIQGQSSRLELNNEDLRLATRQCNIASKSETRKRKQMQAWRLGFDLLQRNVRQMDEYLPCPSLSVKALNKGFESFCQTLAEMKHIKMPGCIDFAHYENLGERSFERYERIELARMMFRRALELWLVLDKALFLEESGYQCQVRSFCSASVTPRNLLIDAYHTRQN